jgi:2-dehydropantoate 2-reductase
VDVAVVGAGSLGSLLGGLLSRAHDVTLVGRDPHVSTVARDGLDVTGAVDCHVTPDGRTDVPPSTELALVTVKAFDTATVATQLADRALDAALSVQNGMGNEETLARQLACPVLAGTCTYGARLVEPGVVACTGVGTVHLGPRDGGTNEVARVVGDAFRAGGVEAVVSDDMPTRLWTKLAVNAGINATTALARVDNGALVDGPAGKPAGDAAAETARVARQHGVDLPEGTAVERARSVAETTAANVSSMRQDVENGTRTEIDAINGYVVDAAEGSVPVNRTLTALVRAWERERGLRGDGSD